MKIIIKPNIYKSLLTRPLKNIDQFSCAIKLCKCNAEIYRLVKLKQKKITSTVFRYKIVQNSSCNILQ